MGYITYRRLAALRELMQRYLCLSWILTCFSPISPDPCMLCHQVFGSVLIRLPRCCLHSSPSCSSPSQTPLPTMFRMQLQVLKKRTGFFAVCSHQPFQLCWICGSPFSPLHGEGNGYPLQYSCLENPMDRGAWQATVHGVTESDMTEQLTLSFSLFSHPCLSVYFGPSVPKLGNNVPGHRKKVKNGPCHSPCSSSGYPCPLSSHSPQRAALDHL